MNPKPSVQGQCLLRECKEDKILARRILGGGSWGPSGAGGVGPAKVQKLGHCGRGGQGCTRMRP